jgi:hypothetical protein
MCATFEYDLSVITLILSFQTLLKCAGAAEAGGTDAGDRGHREGAINSVVAKIVSEGAAGPEGPRTMEAVADLPVEDTTRAEEQEV